MNGKIFVIHVDKTKDNEVEIIGTLKEGSIKKSMVVNINGEMYPIKFIISKGNYVEEVNNLNDKVHILMNSADREQFKPALMFNLTFSEDGKMINHVFVPKKKVQEKGFFAKIFGG